MPKQPSIFINYRRVDTQAYAILLKEKIEAAFEGITVKLDTEDIEIGDEWDDRLKTWLKEAVIMVSLVGRNWLSSKDEFERRRIDDPEDWVRREIEYALDNEKKILTVLVDKGQMPPKEAFENEDKLQAWAAKKQHFEIRPNYVSKDFVHLRDRIADIFQVTPLSAAEASKRENILRDYPLSEEVLKKDPRNRIKDNKVIQEDCPFVGLEYFSRQTARLFFGREKEILDLILTIKKSETRLILLHGYSGVGKSSLLSAGLVPRMEDKYRLFYHRRNKTKGLAEGLKELRGKGCSSEKPVVYMLDQVEEMFSDKNTKLERAHLASQLLSVFREEPDATMLLGFRSEFLAKVKEELCDASVLEKHGAEKEILPLTADGIVRAIRSIAEDEELNKYYYLDVEEGLAEQMAEDLRNYQYADYVAPILQVRLKKMWELVEEKKEAYKKLTFELYNNLGEISEKELLDVQLGKLKNGTLSEEEALRVLKAFVIDKPSAGTIRNDELDEIFGKDPQLENYQSSISALRKVDLLIENKDNTNVRLSHDLLAPIVRERYNEMISDENYSLRLENFALYFKQLQEQIYQCAHNDAVETLRKALATKVRKEKLEKPLLELAFFFTQSSQTDKAFHLLKEGKTYNILDEELLEDLTEVSSAKSPQEKLRKIIQRLNRDYWKELQEQYYPRMIPTSGGSFYLGQIEEEKKESNAVEVRLDTFQMAKTQVTFYQFSIFCAATDLDIQEFASNWGINGDHPVIKVNWYDAVEYCNWLSDNTQGLEKVYKINKKQNDPNNQNDDDKIKWTVSANFKATGYRLPTEAEWEFAARGGNESKGFEYAGSNNLDEAGWYSENSNSKTHPVAQKQPNELGLHDMSGNVWEWCWDWYGGDYLSGKQDNPRGPEKGSSRVLRGGSWFSIDRVCRVGNRNDGLNPYYRNDSDGFRLAQGLPSAL